MNQEMNRVAGNRHHEIAQWITWAERRLSRSGVPSPRVDAELLLASVLGVKRLDLYLHPEPLNEEDREVYQNQVRRRSKREPLQYILGEVWFCDRSFYVSPDVLIPRPETELLVEETLKRAHRPRKILDVGTGSGCIAISMAYAVSEARIIALDNQEKALRSAYTNVLRHGMVERVTLVCGDLVTAIQADRTVDLIIANLPYIPTRELKSLQPEVGNYEPVSALCGGDRGLSLITRLIMQAPYMLRPGGLLALEFGHGQEESIKRWIEQSAMFNEPEIVEDLAGFHRMAFAKTSLRNRNHDPLHQSVSGIS
jgi:release factor glutamine methyltransferase